MSDQSESTAATFVVIGAVVTLMIIGAWKTGTFIGENARKLTTYRRLKKEES